MAGIQTQDRPGISASALIGLAFLAGASFASDAPPPQGGVSGRTFDAEISSLSEICAAMEKNSSDQEAAWPTREQDQSRERQPPYAVRELQSAFAKLLQEKNQILGRISTAASKDLDPLLASLQGGQSPAVIETLVPIAVKAGREDSRTAEVLVGLARKSKPCPLTMVHGLADLDHEAASQFLLELGIESRDAQILGSAGKNGDPSIVGRIIELADGDDKPLAREGLRAIAMLAPPEKHSDRKVEKLTDARMAELGSKELKVRAVVRLTAAKEYNRQLEALVASQVSKVHSVDLKAALITYLGLFKNDDYVGFLTSYYKDNTDSRVRLAILGAVGNLGEKSGEFLLGELSKSENDIATLRDCVHSLGACKYRPAARILIDLLGNQEVKTEAARALHRLSGRDLGEKQSSWARWWRLQPEATQEEKDPEA